MTHENQSCSFCNRRPARGEEYIRGFAANICRESVTVCVGVLSQSRKMGPELVKDEAA